MSEKVERSDVPVPRPVRRSRIMQCPPIGIMFRIPFHPRTALTDDVFKAIAAANDILRLERTAKGTLEIMGPADWIASTKNVEFAFQLGQWNHEAKLGTCFASNLGVALPNGAIRSPDASWIPKARWDALPRNDDYLPFCPDFVVEMVAYADTRKRARAKMREYIEQGARLGWIIDPIRKKVEIYRPGRPVESLDRPKTLSGEDVLPGFVCDLEEIFNA